MSTIKVLSEEPVTMAELGEELKAIKKRDNELNFRANKTEDYLNNFGKSKDSIDLVKKIEKLNLPRLKKHHIVKIVDTMPTSVNDLKVILQGYTITVNNDNMTKIVDLIKKGK